MVDWGLGTYESIAETLLPASEVVVAEAGLSGGETVIDIGCGTGNAALLAAEAGAHVIGVDPAQRLIEIAAAAAEARDLDAEFVLGEAASLPVGAAEADVVLSVFGVIFAPDAKAAAAEMTRVTKSDGRFLITVWIPEGPVSSGVRMVRETLAEITGQQGDPPFPWHDEAALIDLFEPFGRRPHVSERTIEFTAESSTHWVEREGRDHPMSAAARPLLEQSGGGEELQQRLIEHYESVNENPSAFRVTSRYVVAEITPR